MRKFPNVNVSEMTARQPSVPKCMGMKKYPFVFGMQELAPAIAPASWLIP
jgi:hypothetical protein